MNGVDDPEWREMAQRRAEAMKILIERHREEFEELLEECGWRPRSPSGDSSQDWLSDD